LTAALFGFAQVLTHGVVFPLRAKRVYSPGIVSAFLLRPAAVADLASFDRPAVFRG
jgi:hypothetical protein